MQIIGRAYDIITPCNLEDWIRRSWFDVHPDELYIGKGMEGMMSCEGVAATGDRLVIGLNPPFGKNGRLAEFFIQKAAEFRPRHLVLITPPVTQTPPGYERIYEDPHLCREK